MADSEKAYPVNIQPPVYTASANRTTSGKSTIVLSAYSAAVTTLLLAALIFGSLMYHAKTQECDSLQDSVPTPSTHFETKTEEFEDNGENVTEERKLDYSKEIEVIKLTKNEGRTNNGIVVLDYRRSLTAMYLPENEKCFLIGGVDHNLKSPFGEQDEDDNDKDGDDDKEADVILKEADGYPIVDTSILPDYLHRYCDGKEIRWLEKTTETEIESARQKRGLFELKKKDCEFQKCIKRWGLRVCFTVTYSSYVCLELP